MKLLKSNLIRFVIFPIIIVSCASNSKNEYHKNFKKYLINEVHLSEKSLADSEVILVQVEACSYCIKTITKILNDSMYSHSERIVILIGQSSDFEIIDSINEITKKFKTYLDEERQIYRYETGFGKPFLLRFDRFSELIEAIEIKDQDIYSILK